MANSNSDTPLDEEVENHDKTLTNNVINDLFMGVLVLKVYEAYLGVLYSLTG
jgi:hypothetical protein